MLTVSKALLRSRDTTIVRSGSWRLLMPCVIWIVSWCKAVEVEWCVLKPCWCGLFGMLAVIYGRMIFSMILVMGESSEIGLYEDPRPGSLFGLGIGMISASFQI